MAVLVDSCLSFPKHFPGWSLCIRFLLNMPASNLLFMHISRDHCRDLTRTKQDFKLNLNFGDLRFIFVFNLYFIVFINIFQ